MVSLNPTNKCDHKINIGGSHHHISRNIPLMDAHPYDSKNIPYS